MNRWCTSILALCVALTCVASTLRPAVAGSGDGGEDVTIGGPWTPPPPGAGDPDIPLPSVKAVQGRGAAQPVAQSSTNLRAAGDGSEWKNSVMMWRFRAVLQTLRQWYVRF